MAKAYDYKDSKELYEEALAEARQCTAAEIRELLKNRDAFHHWSNAAYEKALAEKEEKENRQ